MNLKSVVVLGLGLIIGYTYSEYKVADKQVQVYGSRDIQSDLKKEVERVNSILDTTEKKNIKKENVPKPAPPAPEIACKCNGTGEIVQADGNKLKCQCSKDGGVCKCKPKEEPPIQTTQPQAQLQVQPQVQYIQVNP
jgi:hypothetical protein